jgi:hypothetical protein
MNKVLLESLSLTAVVIQASSFADLPFQNEVFAHLFA